MLDGCPILEGLMLGILPVPTLEEQFESADPAWCDAQLSRLAKIHLSPFVPEGSIGRTKPMEKRSENSEPSRPSAGRITPSDSRRQRALALMIYPSRPECTEEVESTIHAFIAELTPEETTSRTRGTETIGFEIAS
jgi:hypothetical protein